ncbi:Protein kinase domain-containing protein [Streptomyces sp. cf386]|uniref:protein kinase domain-containing protein n=1 Tax=Streptomyces sp. cf386 TaxID=1761904 RepID=UPI0008858352|nr:Protein kinase domain-containing protein [Streptomyces sp. cf386]
MRDDQTGNDVGTIAEHGHASAGLQLLDALEAAHAAGTLHRDVKPANVLLRPDGNAVLTDLGIAALDNGESLTTTGELVGSLEYMAPEQVMDSETSPASDLWSNGATLATVCAGQSPFRRPARPATLHAVAYEDPGLSERLGPLRPVVEALLLKAPDERPSAARACSALRRVAAGEATGEPLPPGTVCALMPSLPLADATQWPMGRRGPSPAGRPYDGAARHVGQAFAAPPVPHGGAEAAGVGAGRYGRVRLAGRPGHRAVPESGRSTTAATAPELLLERGWFNLRTRAASTRGSKCPCHARCLLSGPDNRRRSPQRYSGRGGRATPAARPRTRQCRQPGIISDSDSSGGDAVWDGQMRRRRTGPSATSWPPCNVGGRTSVRPGMPVRRRHRPAPAAVGPSHRRDHRLRLARNTHTDMRTLRATAPGAPVNSAQSAGKAARPRD